MSRQIVGLVGGVASGKSSVAALFAEECPTAIVDADAIARRVAARPAIQAALRRRFPEAFDRTGTMNRETLAETVFTDPAALRALQKITHPPIRQALRRAIGRAKASLVLVDAPLLLETGTDELCDAVVYVACPARTRRARARRTRGWTEAEHGAREANQWSCRRKRARADLVVDNGGPRTRARRDVRRAVAWIEKRG